MKIPPPATRIQSAKAYNRPDSAMTKYSVKSSYDAPFARPSSGRPTTANTNSRISSNHKSFFGVKDS